MILLDTHVLIWLDVGDSRLGSESLSAIDSAFDSDELAVASISFWEIGMLVAKGRLDMSIDLNVWREELLKNGLYEQPMTGKIGLRAAGLSDFHGDPADRIIVATAMEFSAELITADNKILRWQGPLIRCPAQH